MSNSISTPLATPNSPTGLADAAVSNWTHQRRRRTNTGLVNAAVKHASITKTRLVVVLAQINTALVTLSFIREHRTRTGRWYERCTRLHRTRKCCCHMYNHWTPNCCFQEHWCHTRFCYEHCWTRYITVTNRGLANAAATNTTLANTAAT